MNKAILFFSGGKDSSMALRWLNDNNYVTSLVTIDNASSVVNDGWELTHVVDSFKHKLYDHLNLQVIPLRSSAQYSGDLYNVLKEICTPDAVLCTGEADQINELYDYVHVLQQLPARGLLSPYLTTPKADFLAELQTTDYECVITGSFVSSKGSPEEARALTGQRISATDLVLLYRNNPTLFYTLQTLVVRGGFANPAITDDQIDEFCETLRSQNSKGTFWLLH